MKTPAEGRPPVEASGRLLAFLELHRPLSDEVITWGEIRLRVAGYLTDAVPPLEFVTSVRCVVTKGDSVLVVRNPDGTHIWPGGRRMPGEQLTEAAQREVLEETGWKIAVPRILGFLHLRHLTPRPADYAYPYPDFLQVVYAADAVKHIPDTTAADEYELASSLRSVADARGLGLWAAGRLFLETALHGRP